MPRLPKNQKIRQKTGVLAIFGPRAPPALFPAYFPVWDALRGLREAHFTLVYLTLRMDSVTADSSKPMQ